MRAVQQARQLIEADPANPAARTLSRLVQSLQSGAEFPLTDIYALDFEQFHLALEILGEWRLSRYYAGGVPLFGAPASQGPQDTRLAA